MTWRDAIKIHPVADLLPNVGKTDLKKIGQDIVDHGLKSPIVLWCGPDNKSYLLDGRTRLDALEAVGVKVMAGKKLDPALGLDLKGGSGPTIRTTYSPESTAGKNKIVEIVNPYDFVRSANIRRRHLSKEQQADAIVAIIDAEAAARLSQNGKTGEPAPKPRNAKGQVKGSKKGTRAKAVAAGKEAGVGRPSIDRARGRAKDVIDELCFELKKGTPMTVAELVETLGLKRGTISNCLYRNVHVFESKLTRKGEPKWGLTSVGKKEAAQAVVDRDRNLARKESQTAKARAKSPADKAAAKLVAAAQGLRQTVVNDLSEEGIANVRQAGDLIGKVMNQIKTRHATVEDL